MSMRMSEISYAYGSVMALDDVSFELAPGVTALLGVNGAGKSTLLSVGAGLLAPRTGTAMVSSRSLFARRERKEALRSIAFMPQQVTFPSVLTARDVVAYSGWLKGMSGGRADRRARECLVAVGLEEKMDRKCADLSGGMIRRVALAQALVSEPEVLLLDEPSTGLDPEQRRGMVELIRGLPGTVLMSSHVVEDVADLAETVLILDEGRLVFNGTMDQLVSGLPDNGRRSPVEAGFLRAIGRKAGA
ncbi:MAG: ABC transporter ATP-binding protein [Actinomycetales bacterium]|nr:ABC transporter ATP-binding protein [Actinomycetales bacterium]